MAKRRSRRRRSTTVFPRCSPERLRSLPEAVWVSQKLGVPIVEAFNSISEVGLEYGARPKGAADRIALPIAGDDPTARGIVMQLVDDLGFDPVAAGRWPTAGDNSGQPAYCRDGTTAQVTRLLARADHTTLTSKRRQALETMAKLPPSFPKEDLIRVARFMAGLGKVRFASWLAVVRFGLAVIRPAPAAAASTSP